jgi:2-methylaconitate cis-trans-isomerase PrpF
VRNSGIDYTFVGLGIETDEVDVAGNCGNMISAVGPYAYNTGLLERSELPHGKNSVTVPIRNTNTGKFIRSTFEVADGQAVVQGDYIIDGVSGTGAKIALDFEAPFGSKTGTVLPTGKAVDDIAGYRLTCVDGANPAIFVRAEDVDIDPTILPNDFNKLPEKLILLEMIRKKAAVAMGLASSEDAVARTVPKIAIVSRSTAAHTVLSGDVIEPSHVDLVVRFLSDTQPHRAIPLTAALTTAVAARIPGTIVEQALGEKLVDEGKLTIGHASGKIQVDATMKEGSWEPEVAAVYRTAKRIMDGIVYYPEDEAREPRWPSTVKDTSGEQESLGLKFVEELRTAQKASRSRKP